ncbi:MAG: phosphoglucosamine mutase [Oscillospiraceae bacterium]|nr:phosphoglucosamine mutase [Oscillospiraceae bacterium]
MGKYFGTDGFRGEAGKNLTSEHAYKIGRFLGAYYGKEHKARIVIGKDTRRSSYMLEYALCAGLTSSGADAYILHVTTTPSVSYIVRTEEFDCGIMISASHNPFYDNGIKLINGKGEKMSDDITEKVEKYIDGELAEFPFATGADIGVTVDYAAGRNRYCGYLISLSSHSYKGIRIGIDASNGSAWMLAKNVFDSLGAKTYVINNEPDGININLDCGSTHIDGLRELVKTEKLDIGFAFDGDADRCLAVDCDGNVLTGDHIIYACAKYLKSRGELYNDTVAATIMSNMGFFKALDEIGVKYIKTDVGDKNVYDAMQRDGLSLGGEESGHIIFTKHSATGDGIITSLKIMEAFIESKRPSNELCRGLVRYPQYLENVRVTDKEAAVKNKYVLKSLEKARDILGEKGRILLRKSGTEPVVRVMAEAESEELCVQCVCMVANAIKNENL